MSRYPSPKQRRSRRVTEAQLKTTARTIARDFLSRLDRLDLLEHRHDPRAWRRLARSMGYTVCGYERQARTGRGYADVGAGRLLYEETPDPIEESRRIVHELAHLELIDHGIGQVRSRPEEFDDDSQSQQHRAARMVEELLLP